MLQVERQLLTRADVQPVASNDGFVPLFAIR
jgi:hypothetical protein